MQKGLRIHCWLILLLFCACEHTMVYQKTISLPETQWCVDFLPEFKFHIREEEQTYNIYFTVEYTPTYPYQNLCLTYYLENDTQDLLETALKDYELFDAKTGKFLGSGFGKTKSHVSTILRNYQFPKPGLYTLKMEHFMRTDVLPGLQAIGIKIIRATQAPQ